MTWEALTAVATLLSAVVIAVTVLFAARQVRVTSQQLEHLRRATQLNGVLQILHELTTTPAYDEAQHFIANDLAAKLRDDEDFRKGVALAGRADLSVHIEIKLMRFFETLGALVKYGLIDGDIIYDLISPRIVGNWRGVAEVVAMQRQTVTPSMWENFEWLATDALRWANARGLIVDASSARDGAELVSPQARSNVST